MTMALTIDVAPGYMDIWRMIQVSMTKVEILRTMILMMMTIMTMMLMTNHVAAEDGE